jgi:hypothetical protein
MFAFSSRSLEVLGNYTLRAAKALKAIGAHVGPMSAMKKADEG